MTAEAGTATQGHVRFAGVKAIAGRMDLSRGKSPSMAEIQISIPRGVDPPLSGSLSFSDGNKTLVWDDCRVSNVRRDYTTTSATATITVRDRRWRWGNSTSILFGEWNARDGAGNLLGTDDRRDVRTLAKDCLTELEGTALNAQVAGLPVASGDYGYPHVQWDATNAANALEDLCKRYGGFICLDTSDNTMIYSGTSRQSVEGGETQNAEVRTVVDVPESFRVWSAPDREQIALDLEAVAYDPEGTSWRLVDGTDISYMPEAGWDAGIWETLKLATQSGTASGTDTRAYTWAKKTLFRCYRLLDDSVTIGGTAYDRDRVFERAYPEIVETGRNESGEIARLRPYVTGDCSTLKDLKDPDNTSQGTDLGVKVTVTKLDAKAGIVWLAEPLFGVLDEKLSGAWLTLHCAFKGDRQQYALYRDEGLDGLEKQFMRGDIIFDRNTESVGGETLPNEEEMYLRLVNHAEAESRKYDGVTLKPRTIVYTGYKNIYPDGEINQVSWQMSKNSPPNTIVTYGGYHARNTNEARQYAFGKLREVVSQSEDTNALDLSNLAEDIEINE